MMTPYICIITPSGHYFLNAENVNYIRIIGNTVQIHYAGETLSLDLDPKSLNALKTQLNLRASGPTGYYYPVAEEDDND